MLALTAPEVRGTRRFHRFRRQFGAAILLLGWFGSAFARAEELEPWVDGTRPPLVLDRLDGSPIDLAGQGGRPVVVHFFATWCAPCIVELASLNALAALPGSEVAILTVDVGEVDARVRNFLAQRPVSFPVLLDRDRVATRAWRVESLPTSFVLDRNLKPALKTEGPLDWASPAVVQSLAALSAKAEHAPAELTKPGTDTRETRP